MKNHTFCIMLLSTCLLLAEQADTSTIDQRIQQSSQSMEGPSRRQALLAREGAVFYATGAPLTYMSIIATIIAINSSRFSEGHIVLFGTSGLVLNHTGLLMSCLSGRKATLGLDESDPLRLEARRNLHRYALGSFCALGSAALCTAGGPISWQTDAPYEAFLGTALGLFILRDLLWAPAAFSSIRIVDRVRKRGSAARVSVAPLVTASGSVGGCVSVGLR